MRRTINEYAAYAVMRILVATIQVLPFQTGATLCRTLAWAFSGPIKLRRKTADENLRAAFGEMSEEALASARRKMWYSLLMTACEVAWADRRLHRTNWHRHVRYRGNRQMLSMMLSPRPSVFVSGHFGNFEIAGYVTGLMGIDTLAIARRLDNGPIHDFVTRFRGAKGQYMVDKDGCAPVVDRHLGGGGVLSLLADQHAGDKGCWVNFFGRPASCHKAVAVFSMSAAAPLLVGYSRRIGERPMQFEVGLAGAVDPAAVPKPDAAASVSVMTQWYSDRMESAIRMAPEQYWWLHRRWRPPPEKVLRRLERKAAASQIDGKLKNHPSKGASSNAASSNGRTDRHSLDRAA